MPPVEHIQTSVLTWERSFGPFWLVSNETIERGVKCVVFSMSTLAAIGSLKVKNPGYDSDSEWAENGWPGTEAGSSLEACTCWVPNWCLSCANAEFCRWWSSCCFMSWRRTCCWLAVAWGCENGWVENVWLTDGWGRRIFCCAWNRAWVALDTATAVGTMICCTAFTCVGVFWGCFSFSWLLASVGCTSANFPGCCGCTTTLLTFGDCFVEADDGRNDDTPCVEDRLGSERLAGESFALLAFVSVPFPVFLSSATKSIPQLLFKQILRQRECRNVSNGSQTYVLLNSGKLFTRLHWDEHRIEADANFVREKSSPIIFRTIEKNLLCYTS